MILFAASIFLQIMCVLHVIRTGRQQIWIWVIVLFSALGCCAYFAFEIMPELFGPGSARAMAAKKRESSDPLLRLKAAESALAEVETAANHVAAADAHFDLGSFRTAADHYREALVCLHGPDPRIEKKLAEALFEAGDAAEALALIEALPEPVSIGEGDRLALLKARVLEHMGRNDEALDIYEDIVARLPGDEARCRYAALLAKAGHRDEALAQLEDVTARARRRGVKPGADPMLDWAAAELDSLRAST